jgi:hypothetical protein
LAASGDILKSISMRRDRKFIFVAICRAIESKYIINYSRYFNNLEFEGSILDQLISNTIDRFAIRNISSHIQENDNKEKKESTYRKLQVFKEFEKPETDLQIDEEELLVRTFR